ncbi:hypothetical protein AYY19_12815 [Photobacterium aquimaris]|uniref:Uncharacterized protein n=1 Tax=Photobacterium aquimaris TaxID=512643 RepID=A0A2T3IQP2_9GAMM|nr:MULTISPECIES: hypothetical protein [Photobacterium]OBU17076.1 hypothetical protein AYY20_05430 [Photobacterium aquimaris]OBU17539.1 hypothetical protein AYY19_12815 [Photobacterium aquimaris]PSU30644.1 hypothetical protein CTM88_03285 [Photobacterium aquimaris]PSV98927.1 hypothetical protein CTM91_15495 [Photobacterium aquimaris]
MIEHKIEQWGIRRVEKHLKRQQPLFTHISDKKLCQLCVGLSFLIGFTTTFVIVAFEIYLELLGENWLAWDNLIKLLLLNIVFIGLELLLLFEIGFMTTALLINRASAENHFCDKMKASLVRAVMELSEPIDNIHGIKPYKELSKFRYIKVALYSGKDILSNFLIKAILQKSMSRSSVRVYIPLISTLITGFWDAWVQQKALREVRLRISARIYVLNQIAHHQQKQISITYRTALLRSIAVRQSYKQECDVNLELFYDEIYKQVPITLTDIESPTLLLQSLSLLNPTEYNDVIDILTTLLFFRQRLTANEKKLLVQCGIIEQQKINPLLA